MSVMDLKFKRFFLLAFIFLQTSILHAQFTMPYNIGCLGMNGTISTQFSGPVVIESESCLMIKNGVNNFAIKKNGFFNLNCKIGAPGISSQIEFICFPNPVMTTCTIKLQNQLSTDVSPAVLVLMGNDGRVYENFNTTMKQLSSGYFMNLSRISAGIYVIKILLNNEIISMIKVVKAN
jgi:hypothetical protein